MGKLKEYVEILKDQVSKMFIEKVPRPSMFTRMHYLPLFAVIKYSSATTKLRIVYDPSTRVGNDVPCLNDYPYYL